MKSLSLAVFVGIISAEEMDIFAHTNITPAEIDTLFNPTNKPEPTDPCCHDCTDGLEKYHSVDHIMNNCPELYPGEWKTVLSQHEEREKRLTTRSSKTIVFLFNKKTPLDKKKTTTVSSIEQDKKPVVEPTVRISLSYI